MSSRLETNDDEKHESENEQSESDIESEFNDDSTLIVLKME